MRILLALAMIVSMAAGCGGKKKQTTPNSANTTESTDKDDDMKEASSPEGDDAEAPDTKSADPQEGGQ